MKIERYSDHGISFIFNNVNKELVVTLEYPQLRLSCTEFRFSIPTVISIFKDDKSVRFNAKACYSIEFVILGFGITIDLDITSA